MLDAEQAQQPAKPHSPLSPSAVVAATTPHHHHRHNNGGAQPNNNIRTDAATTLSASQNPNRTDAATTLSASQNRSPLSDCPNPHLFQSSINSNCTPHAIPYQDEDEVEEITDESNHHPHSHKKSPEETEHFEKSTSSPLLPFVLGSPCFATKKKGFAEEEEEKKEGKKEKGQEDAEEHDLVDEDEEEEGESLQPRTKDGGDDASQDHHEAAAEEESHTVLARRLNLEEIYDEITKHEFSPRRRFFHIIHGSPVLSPDDILSVIFNTIIITAVLVSTVTFIVETLPEFYNPAGSDGLFFTLEAICVTIFTLDLILRASSSTSLKHFFNFFTVVDGAAIAGFYAGLIVDAVNAQTQGQTVFFVLRLFRISRVLRIIKLGRTGKGMSLFYDTAKLSTQGLFLLIMLVAITCVVMASCIYTVEQQNSEFRQSDETWYFNNGEKSYFQSIPGSFWFVVVTLTTVGYGTDSVPRSGPGMIVAVAIFVCGVLLLSFPNIIIGSNFQRVHKRWNRHQARNKLGRKFRIVLMYVRFVRMWREYRVKGKMEVLHGYTFSTKPAATSNDWDRSKSFNTAAVASFRSTSHSSPKTISKNQKMFVKRKMTNFFFSAVDFSHEYQFRESATKLALGEFAEVKLGNLSALQLLQRLLVGFSCTATAEELFESFVVYPDHYSSFQHYDQQQQLQHPHTHQHRCVTLTPPTSLLQRPPLKQHSPFCPALLETTTTNAVSNNSPGQHQTNQPQPSCGGSSPAPRLFPPLVDSPHSHDETEEKEMMILGGVPAPDSNTTAVNDNRNHHHHNSPTLERKSSLQSVKSSGRSLLGETQRSNNNNQNQYGCTCGFAQQQHRLFSSSTTTNSNNRGLPHKADVVGMLYHLANARVIQLFVLNRTEDHMLATLTKTGIQGLLHYPEAQSASMPVLRCWAEAKELWQRTTAGKPAMVFPLDGYRMWQRSEALLSKRSPLTFEYDLKLPKSQNNNIFGQQNSSSGSASPVSPKHRQKEEETEQEHHYCQHCIHCRCATVMEMLSTAPPGSRIPNYKSLLPSEQWLLLQQEYLSGMLQLVRSSSPPQQQSYAIPTPAVQQQYHHPQSKSAMILSSS